MRDVCLILSLRALGVPLPILGPGPFRAMHHGNPMLAPFGKKLVPVIATGVQSGSYVTYKDGHFTAAIVCGNQCKITDNGQPAYEGDLSGVLEQTGRLWWRLVSEATTEQRARVRQNRADALSRRQAALSRFDVKRPRLGDGLPSSSTDRVPALRGKDAALRRPTPPMDWPQPTVPSELINLRYPVCGIPTNTWLQKLNEHVRDHRLRFVAASHTYFIDGVESHGSVTGLIHAFCDEFDADDAIRRMMSGSAWPRPEYWRTAVDRDVVGSIRRHPSGERLACILESHSPDVTEACLAAREFGRADAAASALVAGLSMDAEEIKQLWAVNREGAANSGTCMHSLFECWLNYVPVPPTSVEMQMFMGFTRTLGGLTAYRTEWCIFGEEERLAGSVDLVAVNDRDELAIFDWKRSKDLRSKFECRFRAFRFPLQHLDDCAGVRYRLQLNCYKYLIEKYYGRRVVCMCIVCMHPDCAPEAFVDVVPEMPAETEVLMRHMRDRAREQADMSDEDLQRDPRGGSSQEMSLESRIQLEVEFLEGEDTLAADSVCGGGSRVNGEFAHSGVLPQGVLV